MYIITLGTGRSRHTKLPLDVVTARGGAKLMLVCRSTPAEAQLKALLVDAPLCRLPNSVVLPGHSAQLTGPRSTTHCHMLRNRLILCMATK